MLLDSHVLLWLLTDDQQLGARTRAQLAAAPRVWFSAATVWELRIKQQLGKLSLPDDFVVRLGQAGLVELTVSAAHADAIGLIELPHRDPFDRLLLAQAMVEGVPFVTADAALLGRPGVVDARL